jgi:hypothetical protein
MLQKTNTGKINLKSQVFNQLKANFGLTAATVSSFVLLAGTPAFLWANDIGNIKTSFDGANAYVLGAKDKKDNSDKQAGDPKTDFNKSENEGHSNKKTSNNTKDKKDNSDKQAGDPKTDFNKSENEGHSNKAVNKKPVSVSQPKNELGTASNTKISDKNPEPVTQPKVSTSTGNLKTEPKVEPKTEPKTETQVIVQPKISQSTTPNISNNTSQTTNPSTTSTSSSSNTKTSSTSPTSPSIKSPTAEPSIKTSPISQNTKPSNSLTTVSEEQKTNLNTSKEEIKNEVLGVKESNSRNEECDVKEEIPFWTIVILTISVIFSLVTLIFFRKNKNLNLISKVLILGTVIFALINWLSRDTDCKTQLYWWLVALLSIMNLGAGTFQLIFQKNQQTTTEKPAEKTKIKS